MLKNDFPSLGNIFLVPFTFDPHEMYPRIKNYKAEKAIRAVNNGWMALHIARMYTSVSSIWQ